LKTISSILSAVTLALGLSGCISPPIALTPLTEQRLSVQAPIRFLLTFDDGPSASGFANPTTSILDDLANNPHVPGVKAVFFVQTRATGAGGSDLGREIMRREHAEGHILGFHTSTPGHTNHRDLNPQALEKSLTDGSADIAAITGAAPVFLRPPFWNFDQRTFAAYQQHGFHVLMTDVSLNDGKIWGYNFSLRRRSNILRQLSEVRERIADGELPTVDGVIPVEVTFHDLNRYTSRHMLEYMQILLDSAQETGLKVAAKPFYDDSAALQRAVMARTVSDRTKPLHLPGLWAWMWDGNSH
jgi:peptidoglycan/xylan/chitin deacetylase (PgdA/CDA1 family)